VDTSLAPARLQGADGYDAALRDNFLNEWRGVPDLHAKKESLNVTNASDGVGANHDTSSLEAVSADDAAASTLSKIESANELDVDVDLKTTIAIKNVISGETADMDGASLTDFAETSVGEVKRNPVPINWVAGMKRERASTPVTVEPRLMDRGVTVKPLPEDVSAVSSNPELLANIEEYHARLRDLVKTNGAKPEAPDPRLPNFDKIRKNDNADFWRSYDQKGAPFTNDLAQIKYHPKDMFGTIGDDVREQIRAELMPTEKFAPLSALAPDDQKAVALRSELSSAVNKMADERIDSYEKRIARSDLAQYFKDRRLADLQNPESRLYDQKVAKKLAKVELHELAAAKGYTDATYSQNSFLKQQADLDRLTRLQLGRQRGRGMRGADYDYLNAALRYPEKNPNLRRGLDSYVRVAVSGLKNFDQHIGVTYRVGKYSEDLTNQLLGSGTFTERAFFSTTASPKAANFFGATVDADTVFVINSRGGARDVRSISGVPTKEERTFAPNARFKVLKIEDHGEKVNTPFGSIQRVVYLDEIRTKK
jgi:hypothetical protein